MDGTHGLPPREALHRLQRQLNTLVAVLTVTAVTDDVAAMLAGLADTATTAAPLLAREDPAVLLEIQSAFAHARSGRQDETRADLLMASSRLSALRHAERRSRLPLR